jgi:hypothetical protein
MDDPLTPLQLKTQAEKSPPPPAAHVLLTDAQAKALVVMLADAPEKLEAFKDMMTNAQLIQFGLLTPPATLDLGKAAEQESKIGGRRSRRRRRSARSKKGGRR